MGFIYIILIMVLTEVFIRYLTRNMEDKKKREKYLSMIWLVFAVILLVVWLVTK